MGAVAFEQGTRSSGALGEDSRICHGFTPQTLATTYTFPDKRPFTVSSEVTMRRIKAVLALGFLVAALGLPYLTSGLSRNTVRVQYRIDASHPETGRVRVEMTLLPSRNLCVDLFLRDPLIDGESRVSNLRVQRGQSDLPYLYALPWRQDFLRLWTGFSTAPVTISYSVNPVWGYGTPRSYLGPDFGYVRGMVTVYTPVSPDLIRSLVSYTGFYGRGSRGSSRHQQPCLLV